MNHVIPAIAHHNVYAAVWFAKARGYVVCYRTDTGKPHIAKPMGQTFPRTVTP